MCHNRAQTGQVGWGRGLYIHTGKYNYTVFIHTHTLYSSFCTVFCGKSKMYNCVNTIHNFQYRQKYTFYVQYVHSQYRLNIPTTVYNLLNCVWDVTWTEITAIQYCTDVLLCSTQVKLCKSTDLYGAVVCLKKSSIKEFFFRKLAIYLSFWIIYTLSL